MLKAVRYPSFLGLAVGIWCVLDGWFRIVYWKWVSRECKYLLHYGSLDSDETLVRVCFFNLL